MLFVKYSAVLGMVVLTYNPALHSPWNPGRTGLINNIFMMRH
jgi:hypothetical protein